MFLDEDVPFHSDYEILNIQPEVEASKYYSEINSILSKIQDKLNLKILIQLHPRAEKVEVKNIMIILYLKIKLPIKSETQN